MPFDLDSQAARHVITHKRVGISYSGPKLLMSTENSVRPSGNTGTGQPLLQRLFAGWQFPWAKPAGKSVQPAGKSIPPPVFDAFPSGRPRHKRAILIYVPQAFSRTQDDPRPLAHQNRRRSWQMAECLDELGYVVDVVAASDKSFRCSAPYDLLISNNAKLKFDVPRSDDARSVFLGTTLYPDLHNANLRRRHDQLLARRGCQLKMQRVYGVNPSHLSLFDAAFCVGNETSAYSWRSGFSGPIFPFNNFGYRDTLYMGDVKDFDAARRHFLFFASGSQMQKGLDLLLEVFARHPELHLHVCSSFGNEPDFCAAYRKELYETPNVHPIGRIKVNGPEFYELLAKCGYVISASCSEGQSGAVVQCMYAGLIPLVTREVGLDTDDFGITFASDTLEEIESVVTRCADLPPDWLREHCQRTRAACEARHCEEVSMNRWREMLAAVVAPRAASVACEAKA